MATAVQEHRKFSRTNGSPRCGINLLRPQGLVPVNSVNFSDGGLCVRVDEALEVRSLVRLQLSRAIGEAARGSRAVECTGRVAWVVQRLDLRPIPPFLFDVGIEFIDPPPALRAVITQGGHRVGAVKAQPTQGRLLESAVVLGRSFVPRLTRDEHPPRRWHLVVLVDGVPCFSGHYPSAREALLAWAQFRRQQARAKKPAHG